MAGQLRQEAGALRVRTIAETSGPTSAAGAGAGIRACRRRLPEDAALAQRVDRLRRQPAD